MCLVIYAWLVAQDYFKELTDQDVRKRLYEEQKNQIEQDMSPFGFIMDGLEDDTFVDAEGDTWNTMDNGSLELDRLAGTPGSWNTDEYGDRSYMWEYK